MTSRAVAGFFRSEDRGGGDLLLAEVARRLLAEGIALTGAIQRNIERDPDHPCRMELEVLGEPEVILISQDLGPLARGCRLDARGLETAVGRVMHGLARGHARLLIANKFGKQEAEGRGFRPAIGEALLRGVPVLTAVADRNRAAFDAFAGEFGHELPPDAAALVAWCRARAGESAPT